jgi:hypothetical protein
MMMMPASYAGLLLIMLLLLCVRGSGSLVRVVASSSSKKHQKLFWHLEVHKHHDYATLEEIEHKKSKNTLGSHPDYARRIVGDIK